jgi:hypothetical protein
MLLGRWTQTNFEVRPHSHSVKSSPVVVGRTAISRVRLRKFTQQLCIVSGNREHNRYNAKSAESSAEPKHSHRESRFEFSPSPLLALHKTVLI